MRAVLLGATKGMGRALARQMVARGDRVFLLGRDLGDLERSARDLEARGPAGAAPAPAAQAVGFARCDLADATTFGPALDAAAAALGGIDTVVVTAALFAPQAELAEDPARTAALLDANFTGTISFCEEARRRLLAGLGRGPGSGPAGGGAAGEAATTPPAAPPVQPTLCVFSSVAGDRGRKPQVLYGATKAGLSYYLEALDHAHRLQGLRVVNVKPGFVRTGMTAGLPEPPFAGDADQVARAALRAIDRGTPVVYAPAMWRWVMLVIRWLPRFVMRRINF
jgi:decaprenylphospho-beta-D-erythro-pentofuranosid-2-ulose 2-reductase